MEEPQLQAFSRDRLLALVGSWLTAEGSTVRVTKPPRSPSLLVGGHSMSSATVARTSSERTPWRLVPRPEWVPESLFPFSVRSVRLGNAELTFIDEGSGPVLLFMPGSPMWSFMFRSTVAALRDRFRCVVVDLPGLGLSRAPLQPAAPSRPTPACIRPSSAHWISVT